MKNKLLSIFVSFIVISTLSGHALAQQAIGTSKGYELAKLLPASEIVILIESGKIFREKLPQVLSDKQTLLAKINSELDKFKSRTGLDLRDVESAAIGLKKTELKNKTDFEWVALFQGKSNISSKVPIVVAKHKGTRHDDIKIENIKIGNRTIYILSVEKLSKSNKNKSKKFSPVAAIASYSEDTIVVGSPEHVKRTIGESQRVSADVLTLLNRKTNPVITFGAYLPNGLSSYIGLKESVGGDDNLKLALDSIRKLHGSLDINDGNAYFSATAEALEAKDAEYLYSFLVVLQITGKGMFSGKLNDPNAEVYLRMLENAEISLDEKKIILNLEVPKSDVHILVREMNKILSE